MAKRGATVDRSGASPAATAGAPGSVPDAPAQSSGESDALGALPETPLEMAIRAAAEALDALSAKLLAHLRPIPPGHERRYCGVNTRRLAVAPRLAELLRKYPGLVADASPDAILSSLQDARAVDALSHRLGVVRSLLDNTVTLTRADAWQISSEVYNAASGKAKTSATMAEEVAPIRAALKTGDRIDTTARRVAVATHVASKVQAKATTAQQKADAARASHARATEARTARRKAKGP